MVYEDLIAIALPVGLTIVISVWLSEGKEPDSGSLPDVRLAQINGRIDHIISRVEIIERRLTR